MKTSYFIQDKNSSGAYHHDNLVEAIAEVRGMARVRGTWRGLAIIPVDHLDDPDEIGRTTLNKEEEAVVNAALGSIADNA